MVRHRSLLILALGLAACGPKPAGPPNATGAEGNNAAATANAAQPGAPAPAARPAVMLDGGGLRLGYGGARLLAFGTPRAQAIAALTQAFGQPPADQGGNEECGEGPLTFMGWENRLRLSFQDDRFVGWTAEAGLTTPNGIGVGSTRAQLVAALHPQISQSSIGTEFFANGLGGLLESAAPTARITDIWAGSVCIFR